MKKCKVYSDGSHYIARAATHAKAPKRTKREKTEIDDIFAFLYADGLKCDMTDKELREFILTNLEDCFPDFPDLEKYVNENVDRMNRNAWQREKRFRRKRIMHCGNRASFAVVFYPDLRHSHEQFVFLGFERTQKRERFVVEHASFGDIETDGAYRYSRSENLVGGFGVAQNIPFRRERRIIATHNKYLLYSPECFGVADESLGEVCKRTYREQSYIVRVGTHGVK